MCLINKINQKINGNNNGIIAGRDIFLMLDNNDKMIEYLLPIFKSNNEEERDYIEEYANYINSFKELEDYIYSFIFSNVEKKYNFSGNYLLFAKSLLNWIMGLEDFPIKKYNKFCEELKRIYKINKKDILIKRWDAFGKFFTSNISESVNIYNNILSEIDKLNCSPSFLDDMLIDGRNILSESEQIKNRFVSENPFQKEIEKHNRKLTMPIYDRLKADCYESVLRDTFAIETKEENTIMFGNRLNIVLNDIQSLIFNTVFYGSITHMRLCRRVIANVMYSYSKIYKNEKFYEITLKMLALSGMYNEYKKLCLYLGDSFKFWYSKEFIDDIFNLMNRVLEHENIGYKNFIYGFYGKYLSDEKYNEVEESIKSYLEEIDTININITHEIFRNIKFNIMRSSRKLEIMCIFEKYISKNYFRFCQEMSNILNNMDIKEINEEVYEKYVKIVEEILIADKNVNLNMAIAKILQKNINEEKFKKYREKPAIKELLLFEKEVIDNYSFLSKMIENYKDVYIEKEKKPNIIRISDINYILSREFFIDVCNDEKIVKLIEDEYISLVGNILESEKQTNTFKLKQLKNLLYISSIDKYKKNNNKIREILKKIKFGFGRENEIINAINYEEVKDSELETYINLINLFMNQESDFAEAITIYIEEFLENNISLETIIDFFEVIGKSKKDNENVLNQIYSLYLVIVSKDYLSKIQVMDLLRIFVNTKFENKILKRIELMSVGCTYDIAKKILQNLREYDYEKIIPILNNLKRNMNINVRMLTENYEKNICN